MTRNLFDDNTVPFAGELNAIHNGLDREGIVSGIAPSKGTGDWEVDTTAGSVLVNASETSVGAQTPAVTLTDPASDADMDAGESRVDLVTVDGSGTFATQEGTAATDPVTPDIPAGEVVVARILIAESDSTLADSDLLDARAITALIDRGDLADDAKLFDGLVSYSTDTVSTTLSLDGTYKTAFNPGNTVRVYHGVAFFNNDFSHFRFTFDDDSTAEFQFGDNGANNYNFSNMFVKLIEIKGPNDATTRGYDHTIMYA